MTDEELHTPTEWQEYLDYVILDPDGWRREDAPSWDTPITKEEFLHWASYSTIYTSEYFWEGIEERKNERT